MPVMNADYVIHAPDGHFIAAIDAMNYRGLDTALATDIRREKVLDHRLPAADYYLLLSQDRGFLWVNQQELPPDAAPVLEFSTTPLIRKYAAFLGPNERLRDVDLQSIVLAWHNEMHFHREPADAIERSLQQVGFFDAVRDGTWVWETV